MPERYPTDKDKNFDDLAHHFKHNVYGQLKGKIRLAVIERDLAPHLGSAMHIVDAGGGQGQFSLRLAAQGHSVTLCDISSKMLSVAKERAKKLRLECVTFHHCGIQELETKLDAAADLILCHAVLEWMSDPRTALHQLSRCLKYGGMLSLAFFNVNSIIYKNLLRANYRKVASNDYVGMEGSLTPINPLKPEDVFSWCEEEGLEILQHSGIRVFHDYIIDRKTRSRHPDAVLEAELKYSQQEPFRSLGRYVHVVLKKR